VTEKLRVFGVPSKEYVSFVKALTKINVIYPYFDKFIDTIMDFGVVYQANVEPKQNLYYRFLNSVYAFNVFFTPPDENGSNVFYRFLYIMKIAGLAVGYPNSPYPCEHFGEQPPDAFFHAIKTFIILGYTIDTFFDSDENTVSAIQMLGTIYKYDCQLLDFATPDLFDMLKKHQPIIKLAKNIRIKNSDKYLKYYSDIFVNKVQNKYPIIPNIVFTFMEDADYTNKESLTGDYYKHISVNMEKHITRTFMDGEKVREQNRNEYETYNLNMNTLRLFPNFVAAFIRDVSTNEANPHNANFSDDIPQHKNPNKQRGCDRFMHIKLNDKHRKKCPK
jgi:hypothetical protein